MCTQKKRNTFALDGSNVGGRDVSSVVGVFVNNPSPVGKLVVISRTRCHLVVVCCLGVELEPTILCASIKIDAPSLCGDK